MIPNFMFDAASMTLVSALGVSLGVWLRGRWAASGKSNEQRLALQSLAQLHDLARNVAADVDAHSSRVHKINDELSGGEKSPDAVLAAMSQLIEANERMQKQLESAEVQIQQQARQMQSYEAEARTDGLTGIANRRALDDFTRRQQSEFQRNGRPVTMMMVDVDHFKKFNDTYGHQAGDEVLRGVAHVLAKTMRDIDLVARYGGEEFAIVFPGEHVRDCGVAAERARTAIERAVFQHEGIELKVTASFGMAELRTGETIAETIKRADDALYAAKKAGRNNAHWHDGETHHPVVPPEHVEEEKIEEPHVASPASWLTADFHAASARTAFVEDVSRRAAERHRTGNPLSLILVGIDGFHALERQHGEAGGELILKAAAQFLNATMREMDHVARYDEDAFGLLLPGAEMTAGKSIAERLRKAIARCALPLGAAHVRFTVCLGVAEAHGGEDGPELMQRAEATLAAARRIGPNRTFLNQDGKPVAAVEKSPELVEA